MRIVDIRHLSVPLEGNIANAVVNFSEHDVSMVAVITDLLRNGRPLVGFAFNSIGRFAQSGILRDRLIPRLLAAPPESLLSDDGETFDPGKVAATAMRNEKPGGHGDRASALGALELAFWDLNAKIRDEPAYVTIARAAGRKAEAGIVPAYAAGGYYYPTGGIERLEDEIRSYLDLGFTHVKIKIGGASLAQDLKRIEAVASIIGDAGRVAVDANGRFTLEAALEYARALSPLGLRWYEEVGDPLDYKLNHDVAAQYAGALATGENIFSAIDTRNLLRYGGMRPGKDVFQMDPGLSYGLGEFFRIMELLENHGFDRRQSMPHGGHLINLHVVSGLGLGGCEAYPAVFQPFGGYPAHCLLGGGFVKPADAPGFGLEEKVELAATLSRILA